MEKPLFTRPTAGDVAVTLIIGLALGGIGYVQQMFWVEIAGGSIIAFTMFFIVKPIGKCLPGIARAWRRSSFARRLTLSVIIPPYIYIVAETIDSGQLTADGKFLMLVAVVAWLGVLVIWAAVEIAYYIEFERSPRRVETRAPVPVQEPVAVAQNTHSALERPTPIVLDPHGVNLPEVVLDPVWFKDKDWLQQLNIRMPND